MPSHIVSTGNDLVVSSPDFSTQKIAQDPKYYNYLGVSKETQITTTSQGLATISKPLLLACEGGGIRAMTTDAGLIAGLLKSYEDVNGTKIDISTILSKLDAISSNSGSSWFVSTLAYSEPFKNSLQNYSQLFNTNSGYMGLMGKAYIDYLNPSGSLVTSYDWSTMSDLLSNLPILNWANFLDQTIYAPYNTSDLLKATNLHSSIHQRTSALSTQPIIFEAAISVNNAGIAPYGLTGEMLSSVINAGLDPSKKGFDFIPTALTSISSQSAQTALILPTINGSGLFLKYSDHSGIVQKHSPMTLTLAPNLNFNDLSVFTASAASSAALALENSQGASGNSTIKINLAQELATPVLINKTNLESIGSDYPNAIGRDYPDVTYQSLSTINKMPIIRLGDGHYTDGTSVTAGMSYFTPDQLKDGFNVTLFGNMSFKDYEKSGKPDISFLSILGIGQDPSSSGTAFGESFGFAGSASLNHPSNKIFDLVNVPDPNNWNPSPIWSYSIPEHHFLINYYEVAVKTADKNPYAVSGSTGIVRLWEIASDAGMITTPTEKGWSVYSQLYDDIIASLQHYESGNVGATLLAHSLGLV